MLSYWSILGNLNAATFLLGLIVTLLTLGSW